MIKDDIVKTESFLNHTIKYLERNPNDIFWQRKKQSGEDKLRKIKGYYKQLEESNLKAKFESPFNAA